MMRARTHLAALACAGIFAGACADAIADPLPDPEQCAGPLIASAAVVADTANVLRASVSAMLANADSAVVRFGLGAARDSAAPSASPRGDAVVVQLLGLEPSRTYGAQLVAFGACAAPTVVELPAFTTGTLPADLPAYTTAGSSPAPGYVVMAAGRYGLVIDNSGRVVWYHRFPDGAGLNFQAQPNGRYVARPPSPAGTPGAFVEIDPAGRIHRTLGCARELPARMHDMIALDDGSYWLICDEVRTLDLSAQGKPTDARVVGATVQHRAVDGDVLFEWSAFDHLAVELAVLDRTDRDATPINWTHANAIDLDGEGNLLLSFRNLNEVVKIDGRTGTVLWRLGGAHATIALDPDMLPFVHQHGARFQPDGRVQLLDNLGQPVSRAVAFAIDEPRRLSALTLVRGTLSGFVAQLGGSVQTLPDGHTLVSYGSGAGVEEYDRLGEVAWKLAGNPGYVFRAQRIRSLYQPGVGDPR